MAFDGIQFLIKPLTMKTIIILARVDTIDRRKLENLEACTFAHIKDVKETLFNLGADLDGILILDISEYMDGVNNQELDDLSNNWMTYVYLTK